MTFLLSILFRHPLSLCFLFFILIATSVKAQDRCGTFEYKTPLKRQQKVVEDAAFEKWITQKSLSRRKAGAESMRTQTSTYQVPIVFHIIHNGEPVGTGTNLSDEQIYSQLDVINKDFQRLNDDASLTPSEFLGVAGSMDIEFVLAKQTEDGLPTNGIVRVKGSQDEWQYSDYDVLKAHSYWNADNYLNVWVSNVTDYLGYTQFPVSDLPGLGGSPDVAATDGIIIAFEAFGSSDDGNFALDNRYDKGRTLTHEMGHFLGLRHTWGDDGQCASTDYIDDTPTQSASTNICPTTALPSCIDKVNKMYQNYLDYTWDECMNLFTVKQVERMIIVLENSVRRSSLLTSPGLQEPAPVDNDLGISGIIRPQIIECSTLSPSIEIKNYGSNIINTAKIELKINGVTKETLSLLTLNLGLLETKVVVFSSQELDAGKSTFTFDIIETNGTKDGNTFNNKINANTLRVDATTSKQNSIPFRENFESRSSEDWILINPTNGKNWITFPSKSNTSVVFESYGNFKIGDQAWLISPPLDFSKTTKASVFFDLSYALNESRVTHENLKVMGSVGCETAFNITFFDKSGRSTDALSNIKSPKSWKPAADAEDWTREFVNLNTLQDSLSGKENVRIAFVITNGHGNNLYIDNIEFFKSDEPVQPNVSDPFFIYYNANNPGDVNIKFNLPNQQTVDVEIIDTLGRVLYQASLSNILNETYPVDLAPATSGIYIVRLRTQDQNFASRIFVGDK